MMVVGHRGAAGLVPENTLPSWERAIALGCDFIECDVRVTRDGELVIMHDAKIDRTTSGTGAVAELTLAEIRSVDAGNGERVPTLSEFLDLVERHRVQALVEMKAEAAIAPSVAEVGRRKLWPWVFITSGKADWVAQVKGLDSQGRTGVAYSNPSLDDLKRAADIGAAGVGIQFPHLTDERVAQAHELGLIVRGWNPVTREQMEHTLRYAVDGITTDRPDLLLELLGRNKP